MINRLAGPKTHICWTPDHTPKEQRERVCLVREDELLKYEALARTAIEWIGDERMELVRRSREGDNLIGTLATPSWANFLNAAYNVAVLND